MARGDICIHHDVGVSTNFKLNAHRDLGPTWLRLAAVLLQLCRVRAPPSYLSSSSHWQAGDAGGAGAVAPAEVRMTRTRPGPPSL